MAHAHRVRGDLDEAIRFTERGLGICREWNFAATAVSLTGPLGHLYARTGRVAEGVTLLAEAFKASGSMALGFFHALIAVYLGEASLLDQRAEDARRFVDHALRLARGGGQRGFEAQALRIAANVAAREGGAAAADHYASAIGLATELGMRPLVALCHLDRGVFYDGLGRPDGAREEHTRAVGLFRSMGATSWLARAEAARSALR